MSMAPSWVMLGFLLGVAFVVALPPLKKEEPALLPIPRRVEPAPAPAQPQLSTIEAVFAVWGESAVWDGGTTEVALWNTDRREYSDFYEIRRVGDALFFRTIPKLTRRLIKHGKPQPTECPLQFTESEAQYLEWLEHGRAERRTESPPRKP
jgi:hypothetical protein